jgi:hypothetical protein
MIPASLAARAWAFNLHWASPPSSRATIVPSRCVTSRPGGAWSTNAISLLSSWAVKRRGRPGLGRSPRPSMPSAAKRCSRRRTVWGLHCSSLAILLPVRHPNCGPPCAHAESSRLAHAGSLPVCAPASLRVHRVLLAPARSLACPGSFLGKTPPFYSIIF